MTTIPSHFEDSYAAKEETKGQMPDTYPTNGNTVVDQDSIAAQRWAHLKEHAREMRAQLDAMRLRAREAMNNLEEAAAACARANAAAGEALQDLSARMHQPSEAARKRSCSEPR